MTDKKSKKTGKRKTRAKAKNNKVKSKVPTLTLVRNNKPSRMVVGRIHSFALA